MKVYGWVDMEIHVSFTSVLVRSDHSASCPCCFTPGEEVPGTHWIGGWVGPGAGMNDVEE
jgi:hypothetical protein